LALGPRRTAECGWSRGVDIGLRAVTSRRRAMLVGPSGPRPTAWARHAASRALTPLDSAGTAPRRPGCPLQRAGGDIQHARGARAGTSRTAVADSTRTDDAAWR